MKETLISVGVLLLCMLVSFGNSEVTTFGDGSVNADFEVNCTETEMVVYFNLTQLQAQSTANIKRPFTSITFSGYNSTSACAFSVAGTPENVATNFRSGWTKFNDTIWANASLANGCGINTMIDSNDVIYNQTLIVTYGQNPKSWIQREEYDYYNVMCLRNRTVEASLTSEYFNTTQRKNGVAFKNGTVDFKTTMVHADASGVTKSAYKIGEYIFITFTVLTETRIKNSVQRCWATSNGVDDEYELIGANGCPTDAGSITVEQNYEKFKFKTEVFRFIGSNSSKVYIECRSRVCLATQTQGECQFVFCGFGKRKRRNSPAVIEDDSNKVYAVGRTTEFYIVDQNNLGEILDKSSVQQHTVLGSKGGPHQQQNNQDDLQLRTAVEFIVMVLLFILVIIALIIMFKKWNAPTTNMKIIDGVKYTSLNA